MAYYLHTVLQDSSFADAIAKTINALAEEGFGILTQIDIQSTFKNKLKVDFPQYTILGACNPQYAHKALQVEDKIGTMLPCNVIVRETNAHAIEVAVVDPIVSMMGVPNTALKSIASEVRAKLERAITSIS